MEELIEKLREEKNLDFSSYDKIDEKINLLIDNWNELKSKYQNDDVGYISELLERIRNIANEIGYSNEKIEELINYLEKSKEDKDWLPALIEELKEDGVDVFIKDILVNCNILGVILKNNELIEFNTDDIIFLSEKGLDSEIIIRLIIINRETRRIFK